MAAQDVAIIRDKLAGEFRGIGSIEMPKKGEAERPPSYVFEQVALMAAEESGGYEYAFRSP